MIKSFDCIWSQASKRARKLLKDNAGGAAMEMAYTFSGIGWIAMVGIVLLDSAYDIGYRDLSANLLQSMVIF